MKRIFNSEKDEIRFLLPEVSIQIPAVTFSEAVNIAKQGADGIIPPNATNREVVERDGKYYLVFSPLIHIESQLYETGCCATCWKEQDDEEKCNCGRKLCELCIHRYELVKRRNPKSLYLKKIITAITRISGPCKHVIWNREKNVDFTSHLFPDEVATGSGGTVKRKIMIVKRIGNQLVFVDPKKIEEEEREKRASEEIPEEAFETKNMEELFQRLSAAESQPFGFLDAVNLDENVPESEEGVGKIVRDPSELLKKRENTVPPDEPEEPKGPEEEPSESSEMEDYGEPTEDYGEPTDEWVGPSEMEDYGEPTDEYFEGDAELTGGFSDDFKGAVTDEMIDSIADELEPTTHCCECTPGPNLDLPHAIHVQYPNCDCNPDKYVLRNNDLLHPDPARSIKEMTAVMLEAKDDPIGAVSRIAEMAMETSDPEKTVGTVVSSALQEITEEARKGIENARAENRIDSDVEGDEPSDSISAVVDGIKYQPIDGNQALKKDVLEPEDVIKLSKQSQKKNSKKAKKSSKQSKKIPIVAETGEI